MKNFKLLVLAALLLPLVSVAKNKITESVDFLGVDFSAVTVLAADETKLDFISTFGEINQLFLTEAEKYDVGHYLSFNINTIDIEPAINGLSELKELDFVHMHKNSSESDIDIENILSKYEPSEGMKLLIIAIELNKSKGYGTYVAVVFNGSTKEIIKTQALAGDAGGFGLRNFWAKTVYNSMKSAKYSKWK